MPPESGRLGKGKRIKCIKVTGKAECANCTQAKSSCTFLLSNQPTVRKPYGRPYAPSESSVAGSSVLDVPGPSTIRPAGNEPESPLASVSTGEAMELLQNIFPTGQWLPDLFPVNMSMMDSDQQTFAATAPSDLPTTLAASAPSDRSLRRAYPDCQVEDVISWYSFMEVLRLYHERLYALANPHTGAHESSRSPRRAVPTLPAQSWTTAALRLCPVLISDEDITTPEPSEVDDDFITRAGAFAQPPGVTPIIAGFLRVTRLFCILSRILRLLRDMPPDVGTAIQSILLRLNDELESLPAELTPNSPYDSPGFEACKANILVTQALARFELQQLATAANTPHKDAITQSVLRLLDMTPQDYLAANGCSMRNKVLFIASFIIAQQDSSEVDGVTPQVVSLLKKTMRIMPITESVV
ncbi:uncharacterized protein EHS24_003893 [Apiotrichum porosum]|uniref:Zn(2)-C6 fungal-type domain-containing protein n=1 Tax=Apiotrichum porosum TaxID=105984 RepID=A0A427XDM2_9TREE|nr:uncharacterized protein EHS24_003893 [Apiotrichum porosum]RSH76955.1 hypothetical protein EHS24_003893 [Apiotrichum porosum]